MLARTQEAINNVRPLTTGESNFLLHETAEAEAMAQGLTLEEAHWDDSEDLVRSDLAGLAKSSPVKACAQKQRLATLSRVGRAAFACASAELAFALDSKARQFLELPGATSSGTRSTALGYL